MLDAFKVSYAYATDSYAQARAAGLEVGHLFIWVDINTNQNKRQRERTENYVNIL